MIDKYKLVKLIKKVAQELPDVPARSNGVKPPLQNHLQPGVSNNERAHNTLFGPPHKGDNGNHNNHGTSSSWDPGASGSTAIMAMQHALQDLAQAVTAQLNLADITNTDPNDPDKVRREQEAKARDAFGVFLAKNFMRNSKISGVEYDPNPAVTDISHKSPNDPTRMSVVMDTMNRIGNPKKGEQFVDGKWGPRTNAAVRDVYAFASGLFDFVNDINRFATRKMQISSYNKESLQNLDGIATTDNSLTPEQKSEAAPLVTQHVKAIKNMYEEVKNSVLEHPAYRQFIETDVPYKSYGQSVSPQQIDILRKAFPQGFVVNLGGVQANIGVDSLLSVEALKTALQQVSPDGKITPQAVIAQISNQQGQVQTPNPMEH